MVFIRFNRECAKLALADMLQFLDDGGQAAVWLQFPTDSIAKVQLYAICLLQVFDATNSTRERRQLILDHCLPSGIKVSSAHYDFTSNITHSLCNVYGTV